MARRPVDSLEASQPNPLLKLLRRAVVRIDVGGDFRGTGFFVAPGEVLTCAHVVHGSAEVELSNESWRGPAEVVAVLPSEPGHEPDASFYPFPDLALLRTAEVPVEIPCVRLDPADPVSGQAADVLHVYGYSEGEYEPGTVTAGPAAVECAGRLEGVGLQALKLGHDQILPGYSGSPALNLRTGSVCGMVDSTRDAGADLGGFAIPVSTIVECFPDLLARNREYSAESSLWTQAEEAEGIAAAEREETEALPLLAPTATLNWSPDLPQSELLRPRYGVVGLIGRRDLLSDLMLWRESDHPLRVTFVTGGGGVGKTRLALEVCEQARRAGWTAGMLAIDESADVDRELRRMVRWPGRWCAAIDYAEAKPAMVSSLIQRLLRRSAGPPVRLILICRQAQSKRELEGLFATGEGREEVAEVLTEADPIPLDRYQVDRRLLFEEAVAAFAAELGQGDVKAPGLSLEGDHFSRVLIVLAAALLVAQDPDADIESMNREELLIELIERHERQYWQKLAQGSELDLDTSMQSRAVAAATVLGGNDEAEATALVGLLPGLEDVSGERRRKIAAWLSDLYGSGSLSEPPAIGPVEPDMLGEALVRSEYPPVEGLLSASLDRSSDHQLARALTVLARAAGETGPLAESFRQALDDRLPDLVARAAIPEARIAASLALAVGTLRPLRGSAEVLREWGSRPKHLGSLSRTLGGLAVEHLRTQFESGQLDCEPDLGRALWFYASFLSRAGRIEEARAAAAESVSTYHRLLKDSNAHLADMVRALHELMAATDELGNVEATLSTSEELVKYARELFELSEDTWPNLANALIALTSAWGKMGQPDKARLAAEESVRLYRAVEEPDEEDLSQLATVLSNLSVALGELGRDDDSLATATEGAALRESLFEKGHDRSRLPLAIALNNLSVAYGRVGLRDKALETNEEAIKHYRALAEESPRYLSDLGTVLANLSTRLHAIGQSAKALPFIEEAVSRYRELARRNPETFLHRLAMALSTRAVVLSDLGRGEEGLVACKEAIAQHRSLVETDRERFLPELAEDLNNLSAIFGRLDRESEAIAWIKEALELYEELLEANPERFQLDFARCLSNYAVVQGELQEPEAALAACDKAIEHYHQIIGQNRDVILPELASALNTRSSQLGRLERIEEALASDREAILLTASWQRAIRTATGPSLRAVSTIPLGISERLGASTKRWRTPGRLWITNWSWLASVPLVSIRIPPSPSEPTPRS